MIKRFFKGIKEGVKETIRTEYKFMIFLLLLYILFTWPVNYYIVVGGGISDIDSRIKVSDGYDSRGSFNISYVTELQGRLSTYLLSFIMPDWKRVSVDDYKYDENEKIEDIEFRSDIDLKTANSTAIRFAYELAGKKYEVTDNKIYVTSISKGYKTALKIQDQILSINGQAFSNVDEFRNYLQQFQEGDQVSVRVMRSGKEKEIPCTLSLYEERLILGVSLQVVSDYRTDPSIQINFKERESGPSGGLITTLDIYDKLIQEDLTKGKKIAGTGTIEADGSIGEIGEVKYKLLGAVSDNASVFLVPAGNNYKTCMKVAKEKKLDIKIIGVHTIQEAIDELEKLK